MTKSTASAQQLPTLSSALKPDSPLFDFSALSEDSSATNKRIAEESHDQENTLREPAAFEAELRMVGGAYREEHSLMSLVEREDSVGLLQYFLPEICDLAEKLDPIHRVDREDLVGEGVVEALKFVSDTHLPYQRARLGIISSAERAMLDYLVANKVLDIREVVSTDMLASIGHNYTEVVDHRDAVDAARGHITRWLDSLNRFKVRANSKTSGRGEIVRDRLGWGESQNSTTLEELSGKYGVTKERIRQICKDSLIHMSVEYKDPLRDIAATLDCAETKDLIDSQKAKKRSDALECSEMLNRLQRELGGIDFESFSQRYGIGPHRAAAFLSQLYPKLEKHIHKKLVDISQGERDHIEEIDVAPTGPSVESIQRSIVALEERKKTLAQGERLSLVDQVRETYLHLFLADKEECLRQLQVLADECEPRSAAREIFAKTREYFSTIEELEIPGLTSKLESFQKVDVEIATRRNSFLIASEMGTGKSVEALAFALRKGAKRVLIVSTQSSVHTTWPNEIAKHIGDKEAVSILSSAKLKSPEGQSEIARSKWLLVTYQTAARTANIRMIRDLNPDIVILDECHKINHESSSQSKALLSLRSPLRLAVSGSPFKNRLMEIYPVLNWLYPETFGTEREFIGAYCIARNGLFKLQNEMRTRMVYRMQSEVLKLPQVTNREVSIPLEDAQRVEYNKKARNFIASLEERGELSYTKMKLGAFVLLKLHDLRREAVEAKYLDALAIVAQARRKGEKVVLYTTYVAVASKLQEMLREYQPMLLTGVTRSVERISLVKEFASSSERGVFIITAAGGESVDLTPANHFVFLNKPLTYADQEQAVKRVMRRGQRRPVTVHHLTAAHTIDERIEELLQRKRGEFERVFQRDKQITRWFRDNERENVKELVREYIEHEQKKASGSRRRGRGAGPVAP